MSETPIAEETKSEVPHEAPRLAAVDRRTFLTRFAALSAVATAGGAVGAFWPRPAHGHGGSPGILDLYLDTVRPEALADPTECTLAEAAYLIARRRLSPVTLVEAYLDRIDAFDGVYQAWNAIRADEALGEARAVPGKWWKGALHGIPLAIKDNYYTAGTPTTANSYIYESFVPDFDATTVARLKAAGAIVLGKTQMGPLATTRATTPDGIVTTVNAWAPNAPNVNPGGSSSGSATATAGRMASSSVGTQTGGSITEPSNAQGLTGLKPTMGRCSLYGIIPLTYTRDHPGPLARNAKDAAIMLQTMGGPDPNDARTLGLPRLPDLVAAATPVRWGKRRALRWPTTIGVLPGFTSGTSATALARAAMLGTFADLGAKIVDVPLPDEWDLLTGTFNAVRLPERTEPFLEFLKTDLKLFGVSLNSWLQGLFLAGDEYLKGQRAKYLLMQRVLVQIFEECDVVVQTSPVPFDILGLPEIAFPIGFAPNNAGITLPIGTILGGLPYSEDRLLALVAAFQAATGFHLPRPADPVVAAPLARGFAAPEVLRLSAEEVEAQSQ
jgi:Asp-tRNA(Asn)/Glu-tRNA(Gln) amidotransferase A subunit family amidase